MGKKSIHASFRTSDKSEMRVAPAFAVLRQLLVRQFAKDGTSTLEIAKRLLVSRSFVIKQAVMVLKPRTAAERRILKLVQENEGAIKRGLSLLLSGADEVTVLAGGERAAKPAKRLAEKASAKKPKKPKKAKKAEPKKVPAKRSAKPKAKLVDPKPEVSKVVRALVAPNKASAEKASADKPTRKPRVKASAKSLKAPLPAEKLVSTPVVPATDADLLEALGLGDPAPDPNAAV